MSELHLTPTLKRILLEALILTTLAFAVGLSMNYQMVMNAFSGKTVQTIPRPHVAKEVDATTPAVAQLLPVPVELDEIDEMLVDGALLVDARHIDDYNAGHLKGAVSFPLGAVDVQLNRFMQQVEKDRTMILYCSGFGCPDSFDLGKILLKSGYQDVLVYEGGVPEWRDQGRSIEEAANE